MRKSTILLCLILLLSTASAHPVHADNADKTYLLTGSNYYTDSTVDKDFLDTVITTNITNLVASADAGIIVYAQGMTYNEFYLANNIAIEDRYSGYMGVLDRNSNLINTNPTKYGPLTYDGPSIPTVATTAAPNAIAGNITSSRLTVGVLPIVPGNTNTTTIKNYGTGTYFPNLIGYGEDNTVNDYMMTEKNKMTIPTRYNTTRSDITLTMRSSPSHGLRGAQTYLRAKNGTDLIGSYASNPNYYINATANLHITPYGYSQLGGIGKLYMDSAIRNANGLMIEKGVNEFSSTLNTGLREIQKNSGASNIPGGMGGQIQLTGFYRGSDLDSDFFATEIERTNDAINDTEVVYFMYASGDTLRGNDNPAFLNVPDAYKSGISLDNGNLLKLLSPNVSTFTIETTRPFFSNFGDLSTIIDWDATKHASFDTTLGGSSFTLTDNGIFSDGTAIGTDINNIRVFINAEATAYTLAELPAALSDDSYANQDVTLTYTYTALDAKASAIGKLPADITANDGAYAVPFTRTIHVAGGTVTTHFVDEDDLAIASTSIATKVVGTHYTTQRPSTITYNNKNYTLKTEATNKTGTTTSGNTDVTYVYELDEPAIETATVTTYYHDTNGTDLQTLTTQILNVGQTYTTTRPESIQFNSETYILKTEPANKSGPVVSGNTDVIYIYEIPDPQVSTVTVTTYYQDESGSDLQPSILQTVNTNSPYTTTRPQTINYNNQVYALWSEPTNKDGTVGTDPINVIYTYRIETRAELDGTVTTYFKSQDGVDIQTSQIQTLTIGTAYTTTAPTTIIFDGKTYLLNTAPANASGTVVAGNTDVTYTYDLTSPQQQTGTVTTYYRNTAGQDIKAKSIQTLVVGTPYTTARTATISYNGKAYTIKVEATNSTGNVINGNIDVIYTYSELNNEIQTATVTTKYQDTNGTDIRDATVSTYNVGTNYQTQRLETLEYNGKQYKLKAEPSNTQGIVNEDILVVYIYEPINRSTPVDKDPKNNVDSLPNAGINSSLLPIVAMIILGSGIFLILMESRNLLSDQMKTKK